MNLITANKYPEQQQKEQATKGTSYKKGSLIFIEFSESNIKSTFFVTTKFFYAHKFEYFL